MIILEERTVGPSLGLDSIKKGVLASIVGMICSLHRVVLYYRLAGVNAVVALDPQRDHPPRGDGVLNATLTLPGIAGFILTIGMAVDSNVLIFERIREEMDNGKAPKAAIDLGFKRALATIVDTHVTTIAAAAVPLPVRHRPRQGLRRHARHRPRRVDLHRGLRVAPPLRPDLRVEGERRDPVHLNRRLTCVSSTTRTSTSSRSSGSASRCRSSRSSSAPISLVVEGRPDLGIDFTGGAQIVYAFRRRPTRTGSGQDRRGRERQDRLRPALRQGRKERGPSPGPDGEEGRT